MITGVHTIIYSEDAQAARTFFRDVLGLASVDVGRGWLIFALPPAEVAAHPAEGQPSGTHVMYLMCDNLERTTAELKRKGVEFTSPVSDLPWGQLTSIKIPGGGDIGLYQPKHPLPPR